MNNSPAESLTGMTLPGGWLVGNRLSSPGGTGGNFSVRYDVQSPDGKLAFLKALDISGVLNTSPDIATALSRLLEHFIHERAIVEECAGMSRIVRGVAAGQANVPNSVVGPVPYLIFEVAEHGDVRNHLSASTQTGDAATAWKLRSLHHITNGLQQLHSRGIAHQDLKPSNILVFADGCKIGDLGNAVRRGIAGPWDSAPIAGDMNYAPIERFYGYSSPDFEEQRFGYDIYLLGSMVVFYFANVSMQALVTQILDPKFYPQTFQGPYSAVLPYMQNAFLLALAHLRAQLTDSKIATSVSAIVSELCDPDPAKRGLPIIRRPRSRFALEVYVSRFNAIARYAELSLKQP